MLTAQQLLLSQKTVLKFHCTSLLKRHKGNVTYQRAGFAYGDNCIMQIIRPLAQNEGEVGKYHHEAKLSSTTLFSASSDANSSKKACSKSKIVQVGHDLSSRCSNLLSNIRLLFQCEHLVMGKQLAVNNAVWTRPMSLSI